jgi:hypothetical protein
MDDLFRLVMKLDATRGCLDVGQKLKLIEHQRALADIKHSRWTSFGIAYRYRQASRPAVCDLRNIRHI